MVQEWIYQRMTATFRKSNSFSGKDIQEILRCFTCDTPATIHCSWCKEYFVCTIFLKNIIIVNILLYKNHVNINNKDLQFVLNIYIFIAVYNMLIHYRKCQNNSS